MENAPNSLILVIFLVLRQYHCSSCLREVFHYELTSHYCPARYSKLPSFRSLSVNADLAFRTIIYILILFIWMYLLCVYMQSLKCHLDEKFYLLLLRHLLLNIALAKDKPVLQKTKIISHFCHLLTGYLVSQILQK